MSSLKTTSLGVLTILGALVAAAKALLDADPTTVPDYGSLVTAITAGVGLIMARDHNVTSEQAGLK